MLSMELPASSEGKAEQAAIEVPVVLEAKAFVAWATGRR